jgi:Rps23 Pro-64 3,4-dihydroxylase Tpa1-like proline 4-hydroxylase
MPSEDRTDQKMESYALRDQRLLDLIEAKKIGLPDNELLAQAYRRRGDLAAASAEYERLRASGNASPGVELFHAVFNRKSAPARMPETEFAPAPFVQFDDFFDLASNRFLLDYAISKQGIFRPTELQNADQYGDPNRATLVTYDVGDPGEAMRALVRENVPLICDYLNMAPIDIKFIQLKMASYSHGDFFKAHQDNGLSQPDRRISFVYYFHREPKPYQGGDLLLYDSRFSPRAYVRSRFTRIIPRNNSIVFFPSEYFHEVSTVDTDARDFRASRFTLAGHIG